MRFTTTSTVLLAGTVVAAPAARDSDINAAIPPVVPVNTRGGDASLLSKLVTAPTALDRAKLLDQPGDFVFDFNPSAATDPSRSSEAKGKGGVSVAATAKTFPALVGNGASMTVAFLGACGMNTAHVHPRATELNVVVQGRLVTNFVLENGAAPVANTMSTFQMAVFPQGAIHQEFNPDCEEAVFVAAFPDADPGVSQVAQNFFGLRPDVVGATLGGVQTLDGKDIETFRHAIPDNIALGIDACLNKIDPAIRLRRAIHASDALLVRRILRSHPHLLHNPDTSSTGLSNSNLHLAASLGDRATCEALVAAGHERPPAAAADVRAGRAGGGGARGGRRGQHGAALCGVDGEPAVPADVVGGGGGRGEEERLGLDGRGVQRDGAGRGLPQGADIGGGEAPGRGCGEEAEAEAAAAAARVTAQDDGTGHGEGGAGQQRR
ncbi:spherulin-1B precursor [Cordyceps fumosorosea ARSEF 2679]|uniref:Spherulin-1B n=1 Tax=Cordyceps fumosorosea (strain ARSEF 2679) TaxID=1081104 RepID=A0A167QLG2_CORFA|nr:spherulin-1B precursor [Cordyceps fumosorosea ARSEF 2679]OAA57746.1 spherulin-1B precursor [Cordyceps fumosorosea ARSEF 2679]